MLNPEVNRLDYGQQLIPPEGFELDVAIASTYSLDLNALLAVPVALCFNDTLDGDIKGEMLALFEAIGLLKDKLRVFYQKGNIAFPSAYNRLFTLLEPCLQPVIPEGGEFSSFHPKFWLLRYVEVDKPIKLAKVKYKLIVLSRNLTFDRSWDVAISLDGVLDTQKSAEKNLSWNRFVRSLLGQAKGFTAGKKISDELERLVWTPPEHFDDDISLFVGGQSYGRPVLIEPNKNDVLLVMSPFIKSTGGGIDALVWLAQFAPENKRYLFSRAEELNAIDEHKLSGWQCFAMNEQIVKGEELHELNNTLEGDFSQLQNLHAKIIVHQKANKAYWHLGSANATAAALGDDKNVTPRNTEMMIGLVGSAAKVGPAILIEQWTSLKKPETALFIKHVFKYSKLDAADSLNSVLKKLEYQLISAEWQLDCKKTVDKDKENKFSLSLSVSPITKLAEGVSIKVGQLALTGNSGKQDFSHTMIWEDIEITYISALIPVEITIQREGLSLEKRLVIEAVVHIEGGDNRHQLILKSLVDSPDKVMSYLRLLLQLNPDKNEWLSRAKDCGFGADAGSILLGDPIFEQLLIASSRHPKLLIRIARLIGELESSDVAIPDDFSALWAVFGKGIINELAN